MKKVQRKRNDELDHVAVKRRMIDILIVMHDMHG